MAGGHIDNDHGLPLSTIFDPAAGTFSSSAPMAQGRWYPTLTTLPNGEVLTVAGADEQGVMVPVPEIWGTGGWRQLTSASLTLPYYPAMFVAPNGKVFMAGPDQTSRYLDPSGTRRVDHGGRPERSRPERGLRGDVRAGQGAVRGRG